MRFLTIAFVLFSFFAFGQHKSKLGRFSIDYANGCVPTTIHITHLDAFGNIPRSYFYEPGQPDTPDTTHTFLEYGTYEIVQLVGVDVDPKTDTLILELKEPLLPDFQLLNCENQTVSVHIHDTYYDRFRIYFTETDSLDYIPSEPFPEFTYSSASATVQVKGLFNNAFNSNCGKLSKSITFQESVEAPPLLDFTIKQGCYGFVDLTLTFPVKVESLVRIESSAPSGDKTLFEGPISGIQELSNLEVSDDQSEICLIISALDACSLIVEDNYQICESINRPDQHAFATYSGDGSRIVISLPSFKGYYQVSGEDNQGDRFVIDTVSSTFSASTFSPTNSYFIQAIDSCGQSAAFSVAPPRLRLVEKNKESNQITIEITDPVNPFEPTLPSLVIYNSDSSKSIVKSVEGSIFLPPDLGSFQKIRLAYVYDEDPIIYSNVIQTTIDSFVFAAKAFSPNGDGLNDTFDFYGAATNLKVEIFNKWGVSIFKSDGVANWDGLVDGHRAPIGNYHYKISFEDPEGNVRSQVGTFVLIK